MCGFVGLINIDNQSVSEDSIQKMMEKISHRGPDDSGTYLDRNIGLGFKRLSILDLSNNAHQPMISADERFIIVYNGEVYNYLELRKELSGLGFIFYSSSDTEVILNSFRAWGEKCLDKFNGMWAFCIYDKKHRKIFCARDRFGIKPFYYYHDGNKFLFSSEIPSIRVMLGQSIYANTSVISEFLATNRTDYSEATFVKGIYNLPHGHYLELTLDHNHAAPKVAKWYELNARVENAIPLKNAIEFRELLLSSVELRLRSDVPVGTCLSGGLDSSSIYILLTKELGRNDIHTFSAIYDKGFRGDESEYIELLRTNVSNMNFIRPDSDDFVDRLDDLIRLHAEPFPASAVYSQYKVMELASKFVKVSLDGQGADEHLAGYHYFYGYYYKELFKRGHLTKMLNELYADFKLNKSLFGIKSWLYYSLPILRVNKSSTGFQDFFRKDLTDNLVNDNREIELLFSSNSLRDSLLQHFEYKLQHLLKWADRNSMRFSLEVRLPFLDYRLVERSLAGDSSQKIQNGWTKAILRESMKGFLPDKIRLRGDKIGFATPRTEWLKNKKFHNLFKDIIMDSNSEIGRLLDLKKMQRISDNYSNLNDTTSHIVLKTIILSRWFDHFNVKV